VYLIFHKEQLQNMSLPSLLFLFYLPPTAFFLRKAADREERGFLVLNENILNLFFFYSLAFTLKWNLQSECVLLVQIEKAFFTNKYLFGGGESFNCKCWFSQ